MRSAEERAKKAMADAAAMADQLRQEQDNAASIEKSRRNMESQIRDLQARLDEAEANCLKGGKQTIQKLEQRVRELEGEYDNEQRRHQETAKNIRKQDQRLKDLALQADTDRKNQERMQDVIDKLQQKIKTYKRQVEEAVSHYCLFINLSLNFSILFCNMVVQKVCTIEDKVFAQPKYLIHVFCRRRLLH